MQHLEIITSLQTDIEQLKKLLLTFSSTSGLSDKWIPRSEVMKFLNYAPTQMAALEKSGQIIVSKIGKRKFILRESLENLLDRGTINLGDTTNENS